MQVFIFKCDYGHEAMIFTVRTNKNAKVKVMNNMICTCDFPGEKVIQIIFKVKLFP